MKKLVLLFALVLGACGVSEDTTDGPEPEGVDCGCVFDAPDAPDPCAACGVDQICVQRFDGTCGQIGVECQDRAPTCTGTDCNTCDIPHCREDPNGPITFTCAAAGCPGEIQGALHCYGP